MNAVPKPQRIRDPQYLAWIRRQPCLCGCGSTKNQAHHHGRPGERPRSNDFRAVPVHAALHGKMKAPGWSELRVANEYRIDFEAEIERLKNEYLRGIAQGRIRRGIPRPGKPIMSADIVKMASELDRMGKSR